MNKKQRKRVEHGVGTLRTEDDSIRSVLRKSSGKGLFARCLLMLPAVCRGITPVCQPDNDRAHADSFLDGESLKLPQWKNTVGLMVSYSGEHGKAANESEHIDHLDDAASKGCEVLHMTE